MKDWIKGAVKHPGALRAKAKKRGLIEGKEPLSSKDLGILSHAVDATTRRQASLAKEFKGFNK